MKKMLMLASVSSMIDQFNMPNIKLLQEMGFQVEVACNFMEGNTSSNERVEQFTKELIENRINYYQIDFARDVSKISQNIKAYRQVRSLLEENKYEFIHCHSPVGGVIGRISSYVTNTKVIYTAHGFHFFKGAPLLNWLIYYPIEKLFSRYTDILITINKEDYEIAKNKFKAKEIIYIPGIGVNVIRFGNKIDRDTKRKELGIEADEIMILSIGELSKRKNHEVVIKALARLQNLKLKYCICGQGELKKYLFDLVEEQGVGKQVKFLGFRSDIPDICKAADIFVFPSLQEGLPVALMEAMSVGLPIVSSEIRGNVDLIQDGEGGYLAKPDDIVGFANSIMRIVENKDLQNSFRRRNQEYIKSFELSSIQAIMKKIYSSFY